MAAAEEKYRRLPGRRRGVGSSASLWMGSDHILLVKSSWFREEYKRFYLRDIQAIVVARGARFYVSRLMLFLALAWLLPGLFMAFWPDKVRTEWGIGGLAMGAAWLAVSMAGCRCRLYTAVSKDDLPSLYRTWTARRFLRKVQPWIEQVQGVVNAGWADADRTNAGPLSTSVSTSMANSMATAMATATPGAMAHVEEPRVRTAARAHTLVADLFVLSLFVSSLVGLSTLHSTYIVWFRLSTGLTLAQLAGAVAVLVQYSRGSLGRAMQRVAIAALVLIGVTFYVQTLSYSLASAVSRVAANPEALPMPRQVMAIHQATDALGLILGFIGAAIILRGNSPSGNSPIAGGGADRRDPDII
jgi:hypothetical protein